MWSGVQFISVKKSTMIITCTIAITILLLGVAVAEDSCDYGGVVQGDCPIENCYDLGYGRSTFACILMFIKSKTFVEIVAPFLKDIVTLSLMEEDG